MQHRQSKLAQARAKLAATEAALAAAGRGAEGMAAVMMSEEWEGVGWKAGGVAGMVGASEHYLFEWIAPIHGPDMFYCSLTYEEPLN
eukprot:670436-Pelagomonas_calceolata.AAC.6